MTDRWLSSELSREVDKKILEERLKRLEKRIKELQEQFDEHMDDYEHKEKPGSLELLKGDT